ncbi:TraB/GumN family protein [Psychroserpens luteolus]|uniref:TraB/GumN family protein n=1 Tax=Psychroserpens luteolus TaxID=2855840 RepID=UPI001E3063A7|nr:TraB/GumN family protein [Psychroserpens luteolus]MCD2259240.1 TraB/GumN family protein [Psychroserpens luteolus]
MKKLLFCLTLCFGVFNVSGAQELEKSLLWEISGNGLKESSFLYGTIHMTCNATLDEDVQKAMKDTKLLVLELDIDDPSMQTTMMSGLYMKDGKNIKDLVSAEEYETLSKFIKEQMGMPLESLGNVKPFFISAMFLPKLLGCPIQSYEEALMKVAHEQGEEILGLETVEEQLNVFDEIPYKDQVADLLRSAKDNLAHDKESFDKMLKLYDTEDIEGMDTMMKEDKNLSTTKHRDKLLDNRNKNWISKIEDLSKKQPTFFGVGAGHLAGENGVIKLLRKAGYTVKAVN